MHPHFRVLMVVWAILGLSQLILLIPALWVHSRGLEVIEGHPGMMWFCMALLGVAAATPVLWYRHRAGTIDRSWGDEQKVAHYRVPLFFGWVLCEGANMFSLIGYVLLRQDVFLWLFALGFGLYVWRRPDGNRFRQDYGPSTGG